MKTRTSILLFLLAGLFLTATFFVVNKYLTSRETSVTRAKVINPKNADSTKESDNLENIESQIEKFDTLISLKPSETLIASISVDLNSDNYDDEVAVIRKPSEKNFIIVPAIYNPDTIGYERLKEVQTKTSSTKIFSLQGIDVTGEHQNALIYQGINDNENMIMEIFLCENIEGEIELVNIGDFESDGTIFIQQTERSDAYQLSQANGESYSVWVYKTDVVENAKQKNSAKGLNQIQQEYKWNPFSKKYELDRELKVAASRLEAAELSKIQDGTVESFAGFLDGLWYKTSNTGSTLRYFFFDYNNNEIIQVLGDVQEIYNWEVSRLRHNGIYISTVNSSIANLHRKIDIGLLGMDQIRITTWDDVNLVIKQDDLWNGTYKRLPVTSAYEDSEEIEKSVFQREMEKDTCVWSADNAELVISLKDSVYLLRANAVEESGIYSFLQAGNHNIIQFRSNKDVSVLEPAYELSFGTKTETLRGSKKEKIVTDYDSLTMAPVSFTPLDCFTADGEILSLTRQH